MRIVIGGCGRVGAELATELDREGHDVAVIDKRAEAFRRLPTSFGGRPVRGFVFDRETLTEAGIRQAQAYIAVTSGDNSNIVSARIAKDRFDVARVVARIYDPQRARIYERLGVTTIASARWTSDAILRALLPAEERVGAPVGDDAADVVLLTLTVPAQARGVPAAAVTRSGRSTLVAVSRAGSTRVPVDGELLEGGDRIHLAVDQQAVEDVRTAVAELGEHR